MTADPVQAFEHMVGELDSYPLEAFLFVRDGLQTAAAGRHGAESDAQRAVQLFLHQHGLDWTQLESRFSDRSLPAELMELITLAGGCAKLNRHVSGAELCWALRDLALQRWGMLARTVLSSWDIHTTQDFGRIVFGFIDHGLMQKQPADTLDDFDAVFTFDQAFPHDLGAD